MSRTGKATHFTGCFFRRGYLVDNFSISFFDSFKRSIRVCSDVDTDTDVALEMKQISLARNFKGKSKKVPKELYWPLIVCGLSLVQTTAVLLQPETRAVHYSD